MLPRRQTKSLRECTIVEEFCRACERRILRVNVSKSKVMKGIRMVDDRKRIVALDRKLLEEVECFKNLGSRVAIDREK